MATRGRNSRSRSTIPWWSIRLWSLLNSDANLSAAALDTLRKVKGVEQRADFRPP